MPSVLSLSPSLTAVRGDAASSQMTAERIMLVIYFAWALLPIVLLAFMELAPEMLGRIQLHGAYATSDHENFIRGRGDVVLAVCRRAADVLTVDAGAGMA